MLYNVAVSSGFLIKIALSGQGEEKVSGPYASGQRDAESLPYTVKGGVNAKFVLSTQCGLPVILVLDVKGASPIIQLL